MVERAHQDGREVAGVQGPDRSPSARVDHIESFDQCAEVLIGIADRYAAGHVQADDLQSEQDVQMVARGIAAPSRGKKLAANQMPSSSQQKRKHEDSCMDMCDWMSGPPMEEDAWFLSALIRLVPRLTKESRNARTIRRAENTPFTSATHTPRAPSSQPCCCCFFTKAIGNKGPRKRSLSSVAHSPSSRRSTNCLQNVHTDISEHGSIATGRFLGQLPQVCIGRGSWHDRDATDNESSSTQCQTSPVGRKSHEHVKVNLQSRRKLTRAPRRQLYRRSSQRWFDGGENEFDIFVQGCR